MQSILLIAIGGAIGSVARYLLSGAVQRASGSAFPWGTLAVNVLGCLVIGFLAAMALKQPHRLLLMTGVLGGFTTFSTFGLETFRLLEDGQLGHAGMNILLSVAAGFVAVWGGYRLAEWLYGVRI